MKAIALAAIGSIALFASALVAQDEDGGGEVIVTGSRISNSGSGTVVGSLQPPVIWLKRLADSAVRNIEIVSDSRESEMRRREVQTTLLDALDRAKREGFSLVTGQFELVEISRANWQDHFPELAGKADPGDEEDDDYGENEDNEPQAAFEDNGSTATVRLKVKTKLDGSIGSAQLKINSFVKGVPVTGRSQIEQKGGLALTIVKPDQYRDEIYSRIAAGAKHAVSFYGTEYGLDIVGLDSAIAWKQVSNTEVFLYIPYNFSIKK